MPWAPAAGFSTKQEFCRPNRLSVLREGNFSPTVFIYEKHTYFWKLQGLSGHIISLCSYVSRQFKHELCVKEMTHEKLSFLRASQNAKCVIFESLFLNWSLWEAAFIIGSLKLEKAWIIQFLFPFPSPTSPSAHLTSCSMQKWQITYVIICGIFFHYNPTEKCPVTWWKTVYFPKLRQAGTAWRPSCGLSPTTWGVKSSPCSGACITKWISYVNHSLRLLHLPNP